MPRNARTQHTPHENRFEAILDSLDQGVLTLSDDGDVIGINRAACEILEVDKKVALRKGCPCLLGDEACAPTSTIRRSISQRHPIQGYELEIETQSGHRKTLIMRTTVFREGRKGPRGGLVAFRDITELVRLRRDLKQRYRLQNIIGKSKPMREVFHLIEQVADSDAAVLIEGETGTGKELVARAIHHLGPRAAGPFVAVNCSALPETLLESELFGHVRGSFTGALRDKRGRFESAAGGTIFLDEVGDISPAIQAKLLRVLQEHTIERVGGERPIPVDIRVISATNRSLTALIKGDKFREDLYYRLRVVPIRLPALRERREDIPLLAQHFVERFREETTRPIEGVDEDALSMMIDYDWPGNVRELENAIEYAFVKVRRGSICTAHLPPELLRMEASDIRPGDAGKARGRGRRRRGDLVRGRVQDALSMTGWNISKAARRLQVSRTTLYKLMAEFDLRPPP